MASSRVESMVAATDPHRKEEERFEGLLARADEGHLSLSDLRELARLYRIHTSRLSLERHRGRDPERVAFLNALCVRAYGHVYVDVPRARRRRLGLWLFDIPAALGRSQSHQLIAAALLALGALLGAALVIEDPATLGAVVSSDMYSASALEQLYESADARAAFLERRPVSGADNTLFASSLFSNNTRVGWLSLASGVLGAIPTLLLLVYNGLTLGGFSAIFLRGPEWGTFLAWILPHAVAELLAIVLCSAGGLSLGFAVIAPGRQGVSSALRAAGRDAANLFVASLPLFLAAALIESFVRESQLSSAARLSVAVLSVACLAGYATTVRYLARRRPAVDVRFLARGHTQPASRIAK